MRHEGNSARSSYREESLAAYEEFLAAYHFTVLTYADGVVDPREAQGVAHKAEEVLRDTIRNALRVDVHPLVSSYFGESVTVKIGPLQGGSIVGHVVLVLAAGESLNEFRSRYPDVNDSLNLMASQIRRVLRETLRRTQGQFPVRHDVNVRLIKAPALRKAVSAPPVKAAPARPHNSSGPPPDEWAEVMYLVREALQRSNSQSQMLTGFLMAFALMEFAVIVAVLAWVLVTAP